MVFHFVDDDEIGFIFLIAEESAAQYSKHSYNDQNKLRVFLHDGDPFPILEKIIAKIRKEVNEKGKERGKILSLSGAGNRTRTCTLSRGNLRVMSP